jgi:hypothetical protein
VGTGGTQDEDPSTEPVLDDEFVRGAAIREASAAERIEHLRRIEAEHRRLVAELRSRQGAVPSHLRPRRRRWGAAVARALVVAAIVGVAAWSVLYERGSGDTGPVEVADTAVDTSSVDAPVDAASAASEAAHDTPSTGAEGHDLVAGGSRVVDQPSPSAEHRAAPLGVPAPVSSLSSSYRFTQLQPSGEPVAYDPCRPIHVVVNERAAPPGSGAILADALAEITRTTGLRFVVDGGTDELPDFSREPFQPDRYGDRWAPVLVAWSDPAELAELDGDTAGLGGSTWLQLDGTASVYVTGVVVLDGPQLGEVLQGRPEGRVEVQAIIQHELAHLVGLDHVDDPGELMHPVSVPGVVDFGPGDLTGLAELGRGQCFPDV